MNADENTTTAPRLHFGRGSAFGFYILAAIAFAFCMFLISLIPGIEGGGRAIRYQSFGPLCVAFIGLYLFESNDALLHNFHLPDWSGIGVFILVGAFYSLLIVLPLYFYFRTRRSWLLAVQAFALAAHTAFALRVVARFWISQ